MHAKDRAARRAGPPGSFELQKIADPLCTYHLKVFDEAGPVFCPVPFIQIFHPPAREFLTLIAEPGGPAGKPGAIPDDAVNPRFGLVIEYYPAAGAPVPFPQVTQAAPAVHPARGDLGAFEHNFRAHLITVWLLIRSVISSRCSLRCLLKSTTISLRGIFRPGPAIHSLSSLSSWIFLTR